MTILIIMLDYLQYGVKGKILLHYIQENQQPNFEACVL